MTHPYAILGHITQVRSLHGQVVAQLETPIKTVEPIEFIFIQIGHTYVPYQVEEKVLLQSDRVLFKLQGITDRSAAHELVSKSIWLPQESLSQLVVKPAAQDQVVGYHVTDVALGELGLVKRIDIFPMHVCLVIDYQKKELLIPYVSALIKVSDPEKKRLTIHLPGGFLEAVGV